MSGKPFADKNIFPPDLEVPSVNSHTSVKSVSIHFGHHGYKTTSGSDNYLTISAAFLPNLADKARLEWLIPLFLCGWELFMLPSRRQRRPVILRKQLLKLHQVGKDLSTLDQKSHVVGSWISNYQLHPHWAGWWWCTSSTWAGCYKAVSINCKRHSNSM